MKIVLLIFITGLSILLNAQNDNNIIINISNISSNEGQILVKLYNSEESFLKTIYRLEKATINNNKAQLTFRNIGKGIYTFAVFHDRNGNGKMDFNFLGMPKEGVASSNNAKGFFGPPAFEDAKFEVKNEDHVQHIKM